jgi:hypothetical protein
MSSQARANPNASAAPAKPAASSALLVQRKCACGSSSQKDGGCAECNSKALSVQRSPASGGTQLTEERLINSALMPPSQATGPTARADTRTRSGHDFGRIQVHSDGPSTSDNSSTERSSTDQGGPAAQAEGPTPEPAPEAAPASEASTAALIVEDEAEQLAPGQMRKGEFINQLQSAICAEADAELARVGRDTEGCPYIENWMNYYRTRDSQHAERALRRYAPEASGVTTARDYIPVVAARVRRAVAVWATTGAITGVPEELAGQLSGAGALEAAAGMASGAASAIGGIFAKAREGGINPATDAEGVRSELGSGASLGGDVRSRMETGFGHDFSRVRVHTDSRAAELSDRLNARAFTVGSDVAFAAGEYRPGTLVGDALIAHELAHVLQQQDARVSASPQRIDGAQYDGLEQDADNAAVSVMSSILGGPKGAAGVSDTVMPRMRSGLRLSRCSRLVNEKANPCTARTTPATPVKTVTVRHSHLWDGDKSSDFTTHLAYANRVYAIAGITLASGNPENIGETDTKDATLLGPNGLLNDSGTNPQIASYTTEERALMRHTEAAGEVTAYYLKGVENTPNLGGRAFLQDDAVILMPGAGTRTLAHEMGHILMGAGHPPNKDNIMIQNPEATGVDCLSDDQIEAARNNSLAK